MSIKGFLTFGSPSLLLRGGVVGAMLLCGVGDGKSRSANFRVIFFCANVVRRVFWINDFRMSFADVVRFIHLAIDISAYLMQLSELGQ